MPNSRFRTTRCQLPFRTTTHKATTIPSPAIPRATLHRARTSNSSSSLRTGRSSR
ncbi:hypothetical protein AG1IA_06755 [Rhizoctonia solani AG-1 IA]|uniref:Uncharacterized protein n=1 Tax=Thanatephorus cucumeris (strain AG1-IA) TaxID=983506 RepID=L8WM21_THACA|nr:hypothetical protein AG1IA_06755 [Rhizoctonia solani AG-1 IA]